MQFCCLSVLRVSGWRNVMRVLVCTEGEQMEECDENACFY